MAGDASFSEHLHKLSVLKSEQELESLLQLLWQTRKTGLSTSQKSSLHSLLGLPSPSDLDPILPSLRSLIRNCVRNNLEGDDVLKLLPPDLPPELQSMLLALLQKLKSQWQGELSQEQQTRTSCEDCSITVPATSFPSSNASGSFSAQPINPFSQFSSHALGVSTPTQTERNGLYSSQQTLQNDAIPPEFLEVLPWLKSVTWTVENKRATLGDRVAIITLKLQDCSKSHPDETEVKFQLTKDTVEAMVRSMAYINEQLSRHVVGPTSEPLQKRQRQ